MRHRWALWVLIMLTALDGEPIWVESTAVTVIRGGHSQCAGQSHATAIKVGGIGLCVKETADEIKEKINEAIR